MSRAPREAPGRVSSQSEGARQKKSTLVKLNAGKPASAPEPLRHRRTRHIHRGRRLRVPRLAGRRRRQGSTLCPPGPPQRGRGPPPSLGLSAKN